jgi:hypothetical protein
MDIALMRQLAAAMPARLHWFFSGSCVQTIQTSKELPMTDRKSGGTRRHKAARPIRSRTIGKRAPESKRSRSDVATQNRKDRQVGRMTRGESAPRSLSGADEREPASMSESSERAARGDRPDSANDEEMMVRSERPGGSAREPLAEDDDSEDIEP